MKNSSKYIVPGTIAACAILTTIVLSTSVSAKGDQDSGRQYAENETLAPLAQCNAMESDQDRHSCFDRVVPVLLNAASDGSVRVVDAQQIDQTRRNLFGFSLPKVPIFSGDDGQELDLLESTITSVRKVGRGEWYFHIAEGDALWHVKSDSPRMKPPKIGDTVVFKSATMGTYFVRINGRNGVRGNRIK